MKTQIVGTFGWMMLLAATPGLAAELERPHLGQKPPGEIPEVFAPGVISVPGSRERSLAYSPEGDELFFTWSTGWPHSRIFHMKRHGDKCSVYFLYWNYPKEPAQLGDIYITWHNADGTWSSPTNLGPTVNTPGTDDAPNISPDGRYWFFMKDEDIFWRTTPVLPVPKTPSQNDISKTVNPTLGSKADRPLETTK